LILKLFKVDKLLIFNDINKKLSNFAVRFTGRYDNKKKDKSTKSIRIAEDLQRCDVSPKNAERTAEA